MDACIFADAFVGPASPLPKGRLSKRGRVVLKDVKPWMIVIENTERD
jgi:hypothetical protein